LGVHPIYQMVDLTPMADTPKRINDDLTPNRKNKISQFGSEKQMRGGFQNATKKFENMYVEAASNAGT
jgi:hypothetical protein